LHASELDDTSDWSKIKDLKSVTEQNSLDEFLTNAELANSNFESGKYNPKSLFVLLFSRNLI
jgi:hypothetical protein